MSYRDWLANYKNVLLGILVAFLVGIGIFWYTGLDNKAQAQDNALEASYQSAFFDLINNTENLDVLLGKALVSNANGNSIITLTSAWHEAETAKANIGKLPLKMPTMMRTQQYMAQLGDFCYSLAQKIANDKDITQKEKEILEQLHRDTRTMHKELRELVALAGQGEFRLGDLTRDDVRITPKAKEILEGLGKMDERLQDEVPTLQYDGPFSDHVVNREPRGLTGEEISQQEAANIAIEFIDFLGIKLRTVRNETAAGRIPSYNIQLAQDGKRQPEVALGVSQKGGHILWMVVDKETTEEITVKKEEAFKIAQDFVDGLELGEFIKIGYLLEENELIVNFALLEDGIIIYPDMVQVIISMTSGEVVGFDASKYYISHTKRNFSKPKINEADAKQVVNADLQIEEIRLALIPLSNLDEVLCYELRGTKEEDTYYIYVNVETGNEEMVLLIVETENGSKSI